MTDQPTDDELRAAMQDSYPEPSSSLEEPTPPEPEPMSLETFQSLTPEEQATIWNLISLTKDDTTKILELVQPTENGEEDPMQQLLTDILEMIEKSGTMLHEVKATQSKHTTELAEIKKRLPPAPPDETQH